MFTGIIEDLGTVAGLSVAGDSATLRVRSLAAAESALGDSVSINGICLTVTGVSGDEVSFDVMGETLARSDIGAVSHGDRVNIERALRPDSRLGGHIVQGHVDAVARLVSRSAHPRWHVLRFAVSDDIAPLIAEKGSIAVDGVSLTVSAVSPVSATASAATVPPALGDPHGSWFEVSLIPETLARTTLGSIQAGNLVNIETDILARHVARLAGFACDGHAVAGQGREQS